MKNNNMPVRFTALFSLIVFCLVLSSFMVVKPSNKMHPEGISTERNQLVINGANPKVQKKIRKLQKKLQKLEATKEGKSKTGKVLLIVGAITILIGIVLLLTADRGNDSSVLFSSSNELAEGCFQIIVGIGLSIGGIVMLIIGIVVN